MFTSGGAKNSENQREYDDVKEVIKEVMERQVNTSKRAT
jgi:hypothetical protein